MLETVSHNVWTWDDGYGDNKCITGEKSFILPSNYAHWRPNTSGELGESSREPLDYVSVEFGGRKYLVGKSAMRQDPKNSWFGGENKHLDQGFPILMNACLGLMSSSPVEVVDCLVMGLPVESDVDVSRRGFLESRIVRDHSMKITLGDGSTLTREVSIKNLIVKKQPFGSLCDIMLNDMGEIIEKEVATGFNVVVDIGSRTLNVYTLDNLEPVDDLCFHTNDGMYTAYMMVGEFARQRLNYPIPTGKLPLFIEKEKIKDVDLSPIIKASYESLSYEIKKVLETRFINSWAFVDRIIFTGGGSELLKSWLAYLFQDKPIIFMDRFANARGLRKYGIRQTHKLKQQENKKVEVKVGSNVKHY